MYRLKKLYPSLRAEHVDAIIIKNLYNIRYLTGFTGTTAFIVATPKKAFFFTDFRYKGYVEKHLPPWYTYIDTSTLRGGGFNDFLKKEKIAALGFETEHVTVAQHQQWKKRLHVKSKPMAHIDETLRISKTDEEIDIMTRAQRYAEDALRQTIKHLRSGKTERQIADEIEIAAFGYDKENEVRISFKPIVGFGEHSAIPHHQNTNRRFKKGDVVLIDMGYMLRGYCSDMTRTFFTKRPTDEQARAYEIVLRAQEAPIKKMKPGARGGDLDKIARNIIDRSPFKGTFGHSLGHGIGLEVHEAPHLGPGAISTKTAISHDILQLNTIVTSEPGIYLPGNFGIRIEDMIHITARGPRNMTKFKKELKEVQLTAMSFVS